MSLIIVTRSPIDRNTNCVYFGTRDCSGKSEKEKEYSPFVEIYANQSIYVTQEARSSLMRDYMDNCFVKNTEKMW